MCSGDFDRTAKKNALYTSSLKPKSQCNNFDFFLSNRKPCQRIHSLAEILARLKPRGHCPMST
jgi:hypothetical protein